MNKRVWWFIGLGVIAIIIAVGTWYYSTYFQGAGPAWNKPSENIADVIPDKPGEPVNNTNFPLQVPPGFEVSIFAKNVPGARVLAMDPAGNLLVSLSQPGKVVALKDTNHDGTSDQTVDVLTGLTNPHGLVVRCPENSCTLYVAEEQRLMAYEYDAAASKASNGKKIMDLPAGGRHTTRTLLDNDGSLLVSIGSSCDVCYEKDNRRATIMQVGYDGKNQKLFATGLRNTVFMTKSFIDGRIWGTDMGRDMLGNTTPPDEINIIEDGKDYGFPVCYGKNIHDSNFDKNQYIQDPCNGKTPSYIDLPAHVAPLGLGFIPEEGWPEEYWYDLIVAYHGSWNSTEPVGYKLVRVKLDEKGNYQGTEDFITGWYRPGQSSALGRPTGVLVQPGGLVYVADDKADVIYRIAYHTEDSNTPKSAMVTVDTVKEGDRIHSPVTIAGKAVGPWFFEASFPIVITDESGTVLGQGIAQAQGEWMTQNMVPFQATLTFAKGTAQRGFLVFKKDNPSGLPENDMEYKLPVKF